MNVSTTRLNILFGLLIVGGVFTAMWATRTEVLEFVRPTFPGLVPLITFCAMLGAWTGPALATGFTFLLKINHLSDADADDSSKKPNDDATNPPGQS